MLKAIYFGGGLKVIGVFIPSTRSYTRETFAFLIWLTKKWFQFFDTRARGYSIIVNMAENVIEIVRVLTVANLKASDTMNCRYLSWTLSQLNSRNTFAQILDILPSCKQNPTVSLKDLEIKLCSHNQNMVVSVYHYQKQPPRGVPRKKCSENMQQIYRRTTMPKCDVNKVALQIYSKFKEEHPRPSVISILKSHFGMGVLL